MGLWKAEIRETKRTSTVEQCTSKVIDERSSHAETLQDNNTYYMRVEWRGNTTSTNSGKRKEKNVGRSRYYNRTRTATVEIR